MYKFNFKILFVLLLIFVSVNYSFADRGLRKKTKNKVILNINTVPSFKSTINFNLKTGMKFKGLAMTPTENCFISSRAIMSFQKGNTIYLFPSNQQKVIVPEITQGYTGMKLIIKASH